MPFSENLTKLKKPLLSCLVGMFLVSCVSASNICPSFPAISEDVENVLLDVPVSEPLTDWLNDLHKLKLKLERCS